MKLTTLVKERRDPDGSVKLAIGQPKKYAYVSFLVLLLVDLSNTFNIRFTGTG